MNIILGIITGIVSSLGFGPVSITAIAKSLSENFRSGLMVGIGAALMDFIYSGIVLFSIDFLFFNQEMSIIIQIVGIIILTYIGIKLIKSKSIDIKSSENLIIKSKIKSRYSLFYGIIIYISTPTLFAFWFGAISFLNNKDYIYNNNSFDKLLLMLGVFIGTSSWFFILLSGIKKASSKLNLKYFSYFIRIMGCIIVAVAIYFLIRFCLTHF